MVLKRCLNALFSVLYGEMLFGTIGYKELRGEIPVAASCGYCTPFLAQKKALNHMKNAFFNWIMCVIALVNSFLDVFGAIFPNFLQPQPFFSCEKD